MTNDAIVIGAGVAGLSTALFLRRAGVGVTVLDPLGPAGGTSFGNAGALSAETCVPIALPGMLRKVPGWLADPLGPLRVRPAYFPRALPWLLRWIRAGRLDRVMEIAAAMRSLHRNAFEDWRELLGPEAYHDLIRRNGQLQVWEGAEETRTAALEREIRARHGVQAETLGPEELRQLVPGISRAITRGVLVPGNGHTVNPARAVQSLAELLLAEGGAVLPERALKLIPREAGGWMVLTNTANRVAQHVVVAGGAWSRVLLEPLGIRIALETERGYHAALPGVSLPGLRLPVVHKDRGFFITPMEHELRVAGTVEIAGLEAVPDERRAHIQLEHARRLFPDLPVGEARVWLGFRPSSPDSLPFLGPVRGHRGLHLCLGHGHFGMTAGPPSGRLVAALVTGARPPFDPAPYDPGRSMA